jgi:hypothetical protein
LDGVEFYFGPRPAERMINHADFLGGVRDSRTVSKRNQKVVTRRLKAQTSANGARWIFSLKSSRNEER